jgi:hypothetical protein
MIVIAAIFASTAAALSALSVLVAGRAAALFEAFFSVMETHPRAYGRV